MNIIIKKTLQLIKRLSITFLLTTLIGYLIFSYEPLVKNETTLSITQINEAKNVAKKILQEFSSTQSFIDITLGKKDIDSIMAIGSYTVPRLRFEANLNQYGLIVSTTVKVELLFTKRFINAYCLFTPNFDGFEIDYCTIGNIPLVGFIVEGISKALVNMVFGDDVSQVYADLLAGAEIKNQQLVLRASKKLSFKEGIKNSLSSAVSLARAVTKKSDVNTDLVLKNIHYLEQIPSTYASLAPYVNTLFAEVYSRIQSNASILKSSNVQEETTAALWALILVFGNPDFSQYIHLDYQPTNAFSIKTLRGRQDLSLHFLYSVFLQQVGQAKIGLKIGEIKELLDSYAGGSGFSFADLAADKAGLHFSQQLSEDSSEIKALLQRFSKNNKASESVFFPFVHDLPEGFSERSFTRVFQSIDSETYREITDRIDQRIVNLVLYKPKGIENKIAKHNLNKPNLTYGKWLTVDTHIHSNFSDGAHQISEIAQQASKYGCDAIAITDHGDKELVKVASPEYFEQIQQANNQHPFMSVIPAMEWNVPPFNGREHATLLLPEHPKLQRNLSVFRDRYDQWHKKEKALLTTTLALQWLNRNTTYNKVKPLVIYNHPSRKDYQVAENKLDLIQWRKVNSIVTGFSGAPGHQKQRGNNNGSYEFTLHTINGWDPATSIIGGVWDKLLQQGYNVSAARAASDFHNLKMDYWPCQFSTTHLYAENNKQNSIIQAFQRGNHWAQHGKFVKSLNFTLSQSNNNKIHMGQTEKINFMESVDINLAIELNKKDWQGFSTTLDTLELIIITENGTETRYFEPEQFKKEGLFNIQVNYRMKTKRATFRWRGKSIQPEQHQYMFYTNPIYLQQIIQ